jgi:hypothetical protein
MPVKLAGTRTPWARAGLIAGVTVVGLGLAFYACDSSAPTAGSEVAARTNTDASQHCGRWVRTDTDASSLGQVPRVLTNDQLLTQVFEFVKGTSVPLTSITFSTTTSGVVVELDNETHACALGLALAQRFPQDAVFVKVWPPATLAEEGKPYFGTWWMIDATQPQADRLQLELRADGTFTMADRCNSKTGRWRTGDADTIAFSDVAVTLKGCIGRSDVLAAPLAARIDKGDLRVEQSGGPVLVYSR